MPTMVKRTSNPSVLSTRTYYACRVVCANFIWSEKRSGLSFLDGVISIPGIRVVTKMLGIDVVESTLVILVNMKSCYVPENVMVHDGSPTRALRQASRSNSLSRLR